jgi:hypothetical protein
MFLSLTVMDVAMCHWHECYFIEETELVLFYRHLCYGVVRTWISLILLTWILLCLLTLMLLRVLNNVTNTNVTTCYWDECYYVLLTFMLLHISKMIVNYTVIVINVHINTYFLHSCYYVLFINIVTSMNLTTCNWRQFYFVLLMFLLLRFLYAFLTWILVMLVQVTDTYVNTSYWYPCY